MRAGYTVHGQAYGIRPLPDSLLRDAALREAFERRFKRGTDEQCWFYGNGGSYGHFQWVVDGRVRIITASRLALALKLGHWPKHLACHHCDNPPCVNPAHIYDGTHRENMMDAIRRGHADPSRRVYPRKKSHASNP